MRLEERIRVETDGTVTAFSGKIEFGQGIRTAFTQLVANELDVPMERVRVVMGDTGQVPFDFGTFGSHSIEQEAPALRRAAAFARRLLIDRASARLGTPATRLDTKDGVVADGDGKRIGYGDLVHDAPLARSQHIIVRRSSSAGSAGHGLDPKAWGGELPSPA